MKIRVSHQHGFAAIAAIFIVLVLAALGAFMVSFSNTQQINSAQDVQGSRAYWAARAGLEWGVAGTISASACPASPPATIEGFNITVVCVVDTYADAGLTTGVAPRIFRLTATARSAGAAGALSYIERSVSTSLEL